MWKRMNSVSKNSAWAIKSVVIGCVTAFIQYQIFIAATALQQFCAKGLLVKTETRMQADTCVNRPWTPSRPERVSSFPVAVQTCSWSGHGSTEPCRLDWQELCTRWDETATSQQHIRNTTATVRDTQLHRDRPSTHTAAASSSTDDGWWVLV